LNQKNFNRRMVMDQYKNLSTKKLAEMLNVEYGDARGLIKVLEKTGFAQTSGIVKASSGKGKGTNVYNINKNIIDLLTNSKTET